MSIGIIDIGSNSIRLVIYDPPYSGQSPYFNEKIQCRLGRRISQTGALCSEGKESALQTLAGFKALVDSIGLDQLCVVGTAALRDASDGTEFIEQVKKEIDLDIRILNGSEEARLAALGVLQNFGDATGVIGDLGGGSLDLGLVKERAVHDVLSLSLGVLRVLSEKDPRGYIRRAMDSMPEAMLGMENFYTVGGTWRAMAHVYNKANGQPYERLMGKEIPAPSMIEFTEDLSNVKPEVLMHHYKVEDQRAELMPTAALLLSEVLKRLGSKTVIITTSGLRDGLLYEILNKSG